MFTEEEANEIKRKNREEEINKAKSKQKVRHDIEDKLFYMRNGIDEPTRD